MNMREQIKSISQNLKPSYFRTPHSFWFRAQSFFFVTPCSSAPVVTWSWHHQTISADISWPLVLTPGAAPHPPPDITRWCPDSPELHWPPLTSGCDASELTSDGELGWFSGPWPRGQVWGPGALGKLWSLPETISAWSALNKLTSLPPSTETSGSNPKEVNSKSRDTKKVC